MHKALELLKRIPKGKVTTYAILARVCSTSPRAVGRIMASNKDPVNYPCYKVVSSSGKLTGYSAEGGLGAKKKLLERDGINVANGRIESKYFYEFK